MVVAVGWISVGCGSPAEAAAGTLNLGQADNGKTFSVKVGDTIEVVIPGNPTTGFTWTAALAEKDATLLQQVGEPQYTQDASGVGLVGSGGKFTFTFKAVAKGQVQLKLDYARPWESVPPAQTYTAVINIK